MPAHGSENPDLRDTSPDLTHHIHQYKTMNYYISCVKKKKPIRLWLIVLIIAPIFNNFGFNFTIQSSNCFKNCPTLISLDSKKILVFMTMGVTTDALASSSQNAEFFPSIRPSIHPSIHPSI